MKASGSARVRALSSFVNGSKANNSRPGVGVGVIIKKDGKLLFQKRVGSHGEGSWSFPGGHMEFGESPLDTASRESLEEMNVLIKNARVVGLTNDIFESEKK